MTDFRRPIVRSKPDDEAFTPDRRKLAAVKETWAEAGRLIEPAEEPSNARARRLPPGQSLARDMPILDLGQKPLLSKDDWRLTITGKVLKPRVLDFMDMDAMGPRESFSDIHCVTGWSKFDTKWRGVTMATLLAAVTPLASATHAILKAYDGYRTCLPLTDLSSDDILIAFELDGKPLPREHGGPARLVVPHLYFWKSVKWINAIHITDQYAAGTWEARGYHDRGDPWKQERYR